MITILSVAYLGETLCHGSPLKIEQMVFSDCNKTLLVVFAVCCFPFFLNFLLPIDEYTLTLILMSSSREIHNFEDSLVNSFYFLVTAAPLNVNGLPVNESAISLDWDDVTGD